MVSLNESDDRPNHWFIEIGKPNEPLIDIPDVQGLSVGDYVRWMQPGEKYLVQKEIYFELTKEGVYELRAGLFSDGRCALHISGDEPYPLISVSTPGEVPLYQCWKGEIRSSAVSISVSKSGLAEDKESLQYILDYKNYGAGTISQKFNLAYLDLRESFPSSYYTYIAGLYNAASSGNQPGMLEEIMKQQPNHPLSVYTQMEWAISVMINSLDPKTEAWTVQSLPQLKDIKFPEAIQRFLDQKRNELEETMTQQQKASLKASGWPSGFIKND
ncbi:hypothetical protein L0152_33425 [bacterium]|nr:hypothetical protein [bacterium]